MRRFDLTISSDLEIMGGEPCLSGTRIPLRTIASFHLAGYSASHIVSEYPTLTIQTVERATRIIDSIVAITQTES